MAKRRIEVFSAGCGICNEGVEAVRAAACPSCEVEVHDMSDPTVAADARRHGIKSVPAVVIDGKIADCCRGGGIDLEVLRSLGLGEVDL